MDIESGLGGLATELHAIDFSVVIVITIMFTSQRVYFSDFFGVYCTVRVGV